MTIREELELDISGAEQSIGSLSDSLDRAVQLFSVSLVDALDVLNGVQVVADVSSLAPDISSAVESADTQVEVTADTSSVTSEIDSAIGAVDATIVPEVDTGPAEAAIGELSSVAADAGGNVDGLGGAVSGLGAASDITAGSTAGLTSLIGKLGPQGAAAAGGIVAAAAATTVFFNEALEAEGATFRFNQTLGEFADQVESIDVAGLNTSIQDLAVSLGSDDDAVRSAVASFFQLGKASGLVGSEIADSSEKLVALAANARAINPALGSVGSNVAALTTAFSSGRTRGLVPYGISLTSVDIQQRALADSGKTSVAELNRGELAAAGVALAYEKLGSSIKTNIDEGLDNPIIKLDAIRQKFSEFIESVGAPIVSPVLDLLTAVEPIAERIVGSLGGVITALIPALIPIFDGLTSILDLVSPVVDGIVSLVDAFSSLGPALPIVAITALLGPVGLLVAAFSLLPDSLTKPAPLFVDLTEKAIGLKTALADLGDSTLDIEAFIKGLGTEDLGFFATDTVSALQDLGQSTAQFAAQLSNGKTATTEFLRQQLALGTINRESAVTLKLVADQVDKQAESALNAASVNGDLTNSQREIVASALATAESTGDYVLALGEVETAIGGQVDANGQLIGSLDQVGTQSGFTAARIAEISTTMQSAHDGIVAFADAAVAALPAVSSAIDDVGDSADPKKLIDNLIKQQEEVANFSANITSLIEQGLAATAAALLEKGPVIGGSLAQALVDATPATKAAAEENFRGAQQAQDDFAADSLVWSGQIQSVLGRAGVNSGTAFLTGVADGFITAQERAVNAAQAAADAIIRKVNFEFGVASPSKVGIAIGQNFITAIGSGIADMTAVAVAATTTATRSIVNAATLDPTSFTVPGASSVVTPTWNGGSSGETMIHVEIDARGANFSDPASIDRLGDVTAARVSEVVARRDLQLAVRTRVP